MGEIRCLQRIGKPSRALRLAACQTRYREDAARDAMLKTLEIASRSEEDTFRLGTAIGGILRPGDKVLMIGELGSGKTRLAKGIVFAAVCVPPEEVVSPTFTLMNRFEGDFDVYHADLYRIAPDQVEGIGLEDALDQGGALIVEWAERLGSFEEDPLVVHIHFQEESDSRRISLTWRGEGPWGIRLEDALKALLEETGTPG